MKNLNKILVLGLALVLSWAACKKEETQVVLDPNAKLVATLSAATIVLLKDSPNDDVLTVTWVKPIFGFDAAAGYSVIIDKKGNNFAKPVTIGVGSDLKKAFKKVELNNLLIGMGIVAGTAVDLDFKVECLIGASTVLTTTIQNAKVTTFLDKLDLSTPWGIVGSATPGGWGTATIPDLPVYKTATTNELVAYVALIVGEIKMRKNNDWAENLGGTGGVLSAGGANIPITTAGSYKISFNPVALTYKIEPLTWGLIGPATPGGWGGTVPDVPMMYDPTVDLWRADVKLLAGEMKIRLNNDWGTNYGGAAGVLVAAGANIVIATAGTYIVTADFKNLKYTVTPYKPIGIIGDATPNGWGSTNDPKFTYDLSTKTWVLKSIMLTGAQIKFRENDDWGVNWGATGTVEPLPISAAGALSPGGKNFGVTAGTWSFELDFADPANPKYKATKK